MPRSLSEEKGEVVFVRKYNYFLSVFLIIIGFSGIYMASNFETRSGNSGDPGAAFWPVLLCCGLILCSVILLIQTILESKKATEKEDPLIDYRSAGVHCVFLIFVIMICLLYTSCKIKVSPANRDRSIQGRELPEIETALQANGCRGDSTATSRSR